MVARFFLFSTTALLFSNTVPAQRLWTLQECVDRVKENNLQVARGRLSADLAAQSATQARLNLLPTLNAGTGYFFNFGKNIDPTTNAFVQQNIRTSSLSLSSGVTLFGGLQKLNAVRQSDFEHKAALAGLEQTIEDQTLLALSAFLRLVLAKENLELARQQRDLSQRQLERIERLVAAGSMTSSAQYDAQAQLAQQELLFVQSRNEVQAAQLALAQVLDLTELPDVVVPDLSVLPDVSVADMNWSDIYEIALQRHPAVQAAQWQLRSAEAGTQIARGRLLPSVNLFANLSTNYSNLYERFRIDSTQLNTQTIGFLSTDFTPVINFFPSYSSEKVGLLQQYSDNFGQAIGVSVDVPLFNNWQARHQVSRSKILALDARMQLEQVQQQLRTDVQNAWHNALAARSQYEASLNAWTALKKSFEDAQRRLEAGAITSYDFFQQATEYNRAQSEVLQRKYQYIFNLKILDFYQGKALTF
ncbi:MAG: TolC family protein [Chitinophagales bacterium]|nr:TolC family protein [Chitinophagales bacterium]